MDFYKIYHKCYMAEKNSSAHKLGETDMEARRTAIKTRYEKKIFHKYAGYTVLNSGLPLVINAVAMELLYKAIECNFFRAMYAFSLLGGVGMYICSNSRTGGLFSDKIKACQKEIYQKGNHNELFCQCENEDCNHTSNQRELH